MKLLYTSISAVTMLVLSSTIIPSSNGSTVDPTPDISASTKSAANTVGLLVNESGADTGYTLFAPISDTTTYLIDNQGNMVHSWTSDYKPGLSVYLLEDGALLRTGSYQGNSTINAGGSGGIVQRFSWDGSVEWEFTYTDTNYRLHHDVEYLPGGNILMIAWELKTYAEAVAAGRNPDLLTDNEVWPDSIIEVDPTTNTIVWEWHVWDHMIQDYDSDKPDYATVADHPELIDLNYTRQGGADWTHINSVDYNPDFDQIILSVHEFNEIWVIDHSTTTSQAAGHNGGTYGKGGDLLYRWGNPQAYDAGTRQDQQLFSQHDAHWIEDGLSGAGNILIYNNGNMRNGPNGDSYSTVDEIVPPVDVNGNYTFGGSSYDPSGPTWTYTAATPTDLYSSSISGAQRLPNGNTLICEGESGNFLEVTSGGETVWQYINPVTSSGILTQGDTPTGNSVFRAVRYAANYTGLAGLGLTSQCSVYDPAASYQVNIPCVDVDGTMYSANMSIVSAPGLRFAVDMNSLQVLTEAPGADCAAYPFGPQARLRLNCVNVDGIELWAELALVPDVAEIEFDLVDYGTR